MTCVSNNAIQTFIIFKATKIYIKVRGNRISWKKSVLTGKIDGETVYRFQTKYGNNESKQFTRNHVLKILSI